MAPILTHQPKQYASLDDLEEDFRRQRSAVDDPLAKSELLTAEAEAKVAFKEQAAHGKLLEAWRRLAIQEYPLAAKFPQLVTGATEDEIMASAREAHEQLAQMTQGSVNAFDQFRDRVAETPGNPYGRPGVLGGGSTPGSPYVAPEQQKERWQRNFAQSFNEAPRDAYGQRVGISPRDVDRYASERFVDHIKDQIGMWAELTNSSYRGRRR